MLNIPIIQRQMVTTEQPKLSLLEEIEYRHNINTNYWMNNYSIETTIKKNTQDEGFSIWIHNFPHQNKKFTIAINNEVTYISPTIITWPGTRVVFSSRELKNIPFKNVTSISIFSSFEKTLKDYDQNSSPRAWYGLSEILLKFTRIPQYNKSFLIDEKGLEIETYTSIIFTQTKTSIKSSVLKSIIKIYPIELLPGKHNHDMFYVQNVSKTILPRVIPITIEGLQISDGMKKTRAALNNIINPDPIDLLNGIVANISFDENTYYDFSQDKTHIGIGINSEKGYLIPYRYQGDIIPILNLSVDYVTDILIGFSNPIKNPYFDKDSGIIKLKISEFKDLFDNNFLEQNTILNSDFSNLISGNLSLEDIINLGKNDK
ncbi:MAG: MHO_1580 family protein [Metamycoplasmataceae bacterium]